MSNSNDLIHGRENGAADHSGLAIKVSGLSKAFGRTLVLSNLDLEVAWGEVVTVVGPNGSGKTTLIKVLATLSEPDKGEVIVAGSDLHTKGQWIRGVVGVVTHESMLYGALTGYENLKFVGQMFCLDQLDSRIYVVAERLGITHKLYHRVDKLSHGFRKRLAIARALLHDPLVLLMDEPESGLDREALEILDTIVADKSSPNRTVLMTTHNLEIGLGFGQRFLIINRGRIAYDQPLDSSIGVGDLKDAYFTYTGGAW